MARFLNSIIKAKGAHPGSFIFIGNQKMDASKIRLLSFDDDTATENEFNNIEEALSNIKPKIVNWLNVDGLHDISIIQKIGARLDISPLTLDNILNTGQRSRFIEDKSSLILVTKAIDFDQEKNEILAEQISFVLCQNILVSFQEKPGDHFEHVRERIRNNIGHIRSSSADYLLYSLIDALVDNYLINIEQIGSLVEQLEFKLSKPEKAVSAELFHYKTEITFFRKTIHPLEEVMTRLLRSDSELIKKENLVYFHELNDLVEHAYEAVETYFNMIGDQLNIYNTNINTRANDVMKVLTVFASIFIPLTFIVGIYGTNFDYLPELHFRYGYLAMWGAMVLVALTMLYYFKRKKWF